MKAIPMIQKYMTLMPHTVGFDIPLKKAKEMMREYNIRHLPVMDAGKLVGIITDRDISLASSFQGSAEMKVEDVMMPMTYVARPETPANTVAAEMAERRLGSCVIAQENGKVVGIFTSVDACRILADLFEQGHR